MRHLKSLLLVVISYSLALGTPAAAKADVDGFLLMKDYVNSPGKKNFQTLFPKMEKDLPTAYYEQGLKLLKGSNGKSWFQAAKIATNYTYLRFNNSKIFVRVATEKDKTVFYANGIRIHEDDFRNISTVQNKLGIAFVIGLPAPKTSLWNLFKFNEAYASSKFDETATGEPINVIPALGPVSGQTECDQIRADYNVFMQAGNKEGAAVTAQKMKEKDCEGAAAVITNTPAATASNDKTGLFLFLAAAALILLLATRNKKKKAPTEVPEDTNGVGRGEGSGTGGGVNCGGEGAQCGGGGTTTPTPETGTPTAPPTGGGSTDTGVTITDPNYYGENYGRAPVSSKTTKKKK